MADTIQLKRGEGVPSSLKTGEPAFDLLNKKLYIGDKNEKPIHINEEIEKLYYYGDKNIESSNINLFNFEKKNDGTALIRVNKNNRDTVTSLVIPYKYIDSENKEYIVTAIGSDGIRDCINLTSLIIPNSITEIAFCGIYGCTALESISIPDSVTIMGKDVLRACEGLSDIRLSNCINSLEEEALQDCMKLVNITVPKNISIIGNNAFCNCTSLKKVEILNDSINIHDNAFNLCPDDLILICNQGSNAEKYAKKNNINYMYNQVKSDIIVVGPKSLGAQEIYCTYYIEDMSNPDETTTIINQALLDAEKSIMKKVILMSDDSTIYYINKNISIPSEVALEGRIGSQETKSCIKAYGNLTVTIEMNVSSQIKNMRIYGVTLTSKKGNYISFCDIWKSNIIFTEENNVFEFNTTKTKDFLIQVFSNNNKIVNNSITGNIEVGNVSKNIIVNNIVDGSITNNGTNNLVTNNLLLIE
jgi:hypothetical protein